MERRRDPRFGADGNGDLMMWVAASMWKLLRLTDRGHVGQLLYRTTAPAGGIASEYHPVAVG